MLIGAVRLDLPMALRGSEARHVTIQVKYTNPDGREVIHSPSILEPGGRAGKYAFDLRQPERKRPVVSEEASLPLDQIKREKGVW